MRCRAAFAAAADKIAGADWRDPDQVDAWVQALPKGRDIVTYCVYGFEVSSNAAAALRARGHRARYLAGGIAAWHALGGPLSKKDASG